jgi:SAM-dependent methyltransferase
MMPNSINERNEDSYNVFISAATKDKVYALEIERILKDAKLDVYCDLGDDSTDREIAGILPGNNITDEISRAISQSSSFIALLSKRTCGSSWVTKEIDIRLHQENEKRRSVIPVYLDEIAEKHWEEKLGNIRGIHCSGFSSITENASEILRALGVVSIDAAVQDRIASKSLQDVLQEIAETEILSFYEPIRLDLVTDLRDAVSEMRLHGRCRLPMTRYYGVIGDILSRVNKGGTIKVTNILSHKEWQTRDFSVDYLQEESRLIKTRHLQVERYFIGTPLRFEADGVRKLIERNRQAGVRVHNVFIDENMTNQGRFNRDIGLYQTTPICFVEGIHEGGYLKSGEIGTQQSLVEEIEQVFREVESYSTQYFERTELERYALRRSKGGWRAPYFNEDRPAWQEKPCPMLVKYFPRLLATAAQRAVVEKRGYISILDAGCGDGRNMLFCIEAINNLPRETRRRLTFRLLGVDICDSAIQQCRRILSAISCPTNIVVHVAEGNIVDELPAVRETVDILVCADTFGQLYPTEVVHALDEWCRVLRRRGNLLINVYTPEDDTLRHCINDIENGFVGSEVDSNYDHAYWYRDTYYKYYERDELITLLKSRHKNRQLASVRVIQEEWCDPPHSEYRTVTHTHRNWVVIAESYESL